MSEKQTAADTADKPKNFPGVGLIETGGKASWRGIKGIAGYISNLVRGVVTGTVRGTVGAVFGTLPDTLHHAGDSLKEIQAVSEKAGTEMKEAHNIGKLGPAISGIIDGTFGAVANTLKWPFKLVGGAAKRVTKGASEILASTVYKFDEMSGNGKESASAA